MSILSVEPMPLFFSNHNAVLTWAPKSACTHVVVWFLNREGLLRAANYYNGWPHTFRIEVYYKSAVYMKRRRAFTESGGVGYTEIRVVRDPVKRLVSCFRHACRYDFLRPFIMQRLGFDTAEEGLSLLDYYAALKGEKLTMPSTVNVHACAQVHPLWDMPFDRTITLNIDETPMNPGLNAIETDFGWQQTQFDQIPKFAAIRQQHYTQNQDYVGDVPLEQVRFKPQDTNPFPKKQFEAMDLVRQMAEELHAADFGRVTAGDTAGRLFQKHEAE